MFAACANETSYKVERKRRILNSLEETKVSEVEKKVMTKLEFDPDSMEQLSTLNELLDETKKDMKAAEAMSAFKDLALPKY